MLGFASLLGITMGVDVIHSNSKLLIQWVSNEYHILAVPVVEPFLPHTPWGRSTYTSYLRSLVVIDESWKSWIHLSFVAAPLDMVEPHCQRLTWDWNWTLVRDTMEGAPEELAIDDCLCSPWLSLLHPCWISTPIFTKWGIYGGPCLISLLLILLRAWILQIRLLNLLHFIWIIRRQQLAWYLRTKFWLRNLLPNSSIDCHRWW